MVAMEGEGRWAMVAVMREGGAGVQACRMAGAAGRKAVAAGASETVREVAVMAVAVTMAEVMAEVVTGEVLVEVEANEGRAPPRPI